MFALQRARKASPSGPFFKTFFICSFIDLRSVASLSDAERTTEDALRRELLVDWDELFAVKPAS